MLYYPCQGICWRRWLTIYCEADKQEELIKKMNNDTTPSSATSEMHYYTSILDIMGDTPLVGLNRVASGVSPLVLAKMEMFNPGGSVKDRIGPAMIDYCEQRGLLRPGGTIVEPTSGNTGHGLAIAAAIKGYHCIFVMTDKVSEEKRSLLRAYGAEVVICPSSVTYDSPEHYKNVAHRLAHEIPGACCPDQYSNPANPMTHYLTTGPEIWRDTAGRITAFVAGIGTGGTISGVGRYLKEQNTNIKVIGADPPGSVYSGDTPGPYKSAGTAMGAALTYARRLTRNGVVVVLLADTGRGYLSKIFNDTWMRENNMLVQAETDQPTLRDVLTYRRTHARTMPLVVSVIPTDTIADAVELLRRYGISQTPVMDNGRMVGSLTENLLLRHLASGESLTSSIVRDLQGPPFPELEADALAQEAYTLFSSGQSAVAVMNGEMLEGIVTKSDLLEFWAHNRSESSTPG